MSECQKLINPENKNLSDNLMDLAVDQESFARKLSERRKEAGSWKKLAQ